MCSPFPVMIHSQLFVQLYCWLLFHLVALFSIATKEAQHCCSNKEKGMPPSAIMASWFSVTWQFHTNCA
jgi:hypothetical protein